MPATISAVLYMPGVKRIHCLNCARSYRGYASQVYKIDYTWPAVEAVTTAYVCLECARSPGIAIQLTKQILGKELGVSI